MPDQSYEDIVYLAHQILTGAGITGASGCECDDPDCQSLLIHRLKHILIPELTQLRLKNKNSLANNLCPDHRDKIGQQECLKCQLEKLQKKYQQIQSPYRDANEILEDYQFTVLKDDKK